MVDRSMPLTREKSEDAQDFVLQDPRAMVKVDLPEAQLPAMQRYIPRLQRLRRGHQNMTNNKWSSKSSV
jgi:hypothetical protein